VIPVKMYNKYQWQYLDSWKIGDTLPANQTQSDSEVYFK